ncbi:MAG: sugar phosphate isomerase/epimerase family protein [Paracoccaceae bacterium]|nr:sugar phosphate isomerase/epimerase family protein [Paracoccaceae bacterium]
MARLGLHTFATAAKWDVPTMRALLPKLHAQKVRVLEIPLLDPREIDTDETRVFLEEVGIEPVCSLGLPPEIDVVSDPEAGLAFLEPAFQVAAAVGATALSGVTYGTIGRTSGAPRTAREFDATAAFIGRAGARAAEFGLKLGVEPCNRYETHLMNTAADARAFCEASGAKNVFIHLDTYHMNIEEVSFAEAFRTCGGWLGYVHLSESNRGAPGAGMVDWAAAFAALVDVGFDGITTLESMNHVHPAIAAGLAIWRPVAETPGDVIDKGLAHLHRAAEVAGFRYA